MLPYFILGVSLVAGGLLAARWVADADPKALLRALRWTGLILGGTLFLYLALTGKLFHAIAALTLAAPMLMRLAQLRGMWRWARNAAGPRQGQSSAVNTDYLAMQLDHDSGEMTGRVVAGRFSGRTLDSMSLPELLALLRECRAADPQSAAVLEAYLDRSQTEDWREADTGAGPGAEGAGGDGAAGSGTMSREEAYEILGLQPGAGPEEVKEAHRRLLQKIHPDHGGSNYLAAKINQAKDLLLRDS
jgi:hypothetical protein